MKWHDIQNQFGVVHTDGTTIVGFEEKPVYTSQINAGVYVLNPDTLSLLPTNSYYDMPDLFEAAGRQHAFAGFRHLRVLA